MTIPPDITERAARFQLELDPAELARLDEFLHLLLRANEQFNLTAIRDEDEAWTRHILDSLTLLPLLAEAEVRTAVDVGAGGGLPGIPLAVCLPDVQFTLIETTGKKAHFLENATKQLSLDNVTVVNDRAETLGQDRRYRELFDAVLARAVGPLNVLTELTIPLARVGGLIFAIKGQRADEELAAAKQALYKLHAHHTDTIATPTGRIVMIQKVRKTPREYPRRPGEPKRSPL